ncbi:MAG TPA: HypC/HybG/HupF family hydrogenase formation chaperone [Lacunisphaera sp.]|nr:HypC/HybG/HupF family hydrogenase formation chaperone [Lacunisphaera sp.]
MCLAVPGKVIEIIGDDPLLRSAKVSFAGVVKLVSLTCTPEAKPGDYVLVHVGVAISTVDPQEAEETFQYLKAMGELDGIDGPPDDKPIGAVALNGPGRLGASAPTPTVKPTTP